MSRPSDYGIEKAWAHVPTPSYAADKSWADSLTPQVAEIVARALKMQGTVRLDDPTLDQDRKENTDLVVKIIYPKGDRLAMRVRRHGQLVMYGGTDFTIRSSRPGGTKTELEKILEGWGDWFFYGFDDGEGKLCVWTLIDLNIFRNIQSELHYEEKRNHDGSSCFRIYKISDAQKAVVDSFDYRLVTVISDAQRELQEFAVLSMGQRLADVCPGCGQHTIDRISTRIGFVKDGGITECRRCSIVLRWDASQQVKTRS